MTTYTEKLLTAIATYEVKCCIDTPESILESLWYNYSCLNPVDDGQIREAEAMLSPVFEELSMEASDRLFDMIVAFLTRYQRAAYLDGLRTGVHLIEELA